MTTTEERRSLPFILARHVPCAGDADGEWVHCACHSEPDGHCDTAVVKEAAERLANATQSLLRVSETPLYDGVQMADSWTEADAALTELRP